MVPPLIPLSHWPVVIRDLKLIGASYKLLAVPVFPIIVYIMYVLLDNQSELFVNSVEVTCCENMYIRVLQ